MPSYTRNRRAPQGIAALAPELLSQLEAWLADPALTLATICTMAREQLAVKVSSSGVSGWCKRRGITASAASLPVHRTHAGFAITVTAPGATSITVAVNPLA